MVGRIKVKVQQQQLQRTSQSGDRGSGLARTVTEINTELMEDVGSNSMFGSTNHPQ